MKKLLLSTIVLGSAFLSSAQIIFNVLQPSSLEGSYDLEYAEWGATPDMTNPANAVTGFLQLVDDGSAADSLGCGTLVNTADFTKGGVIGSLIIDSGSGYADATAVAVTGGSGSGLTLDITVSEGGEVIALEDATLVGGTGYSDDTDVATTTDGAGIGLTVDITTTPATGEVLILDVTTFIPGTGYVTANDVTTTTDGAGTGLTVDIIANPLDYVTSLDDLTLNPGSEYEDATDVATTSDGTGTGLTVDIEANPKDVVTSLDITSLSAGTGYEDATDVATTSDGSGSGLTVDIEANPRDVIISVELINVGTGYDADIFDAPYNGGSGSGLVIDITTDGDAVTNVTIIDGGQNYQMGDMITIDAGDGNATFIVDDIDAGGDITSITINNGGAGYAIGEEITISTGDENATILVDDIDEGGEITSVTINNAGEGYAIGDVITILTGSETATILVDGINVGGEITFGDLIDGGTGYAVGDLIIIDGGNGDATVQVQEVEEGGVITAVVINNAGTGYEIGDEIYITGGDDNASIIVEEVSEGGQILTVTVNNSGTNYEVGDVVTIVGGDDNAEVEITDVAAGKIAVVYRGDCEFGVKAFNAWSAGAAAVIIVNNVPGGPLGMLAGASGDVVEVPVIMISMEDGALLRSEIEAGNVEAFIGSKSGLFENDYGMFANDVVYPGKTAIPSILATNASEFSYTPGAWIHNYGFANQTTGTLTVTITRGATEVYNEVSTNISINTGDSVFISMPIFSLATYPVGYYEVTFTVGFDDKTDDFVGDNTIKTSFLINDDLMFANAQVDANGNFIAGGGLRAQGIASFGACVVFRDANASRVLLDGIHFGASKSEQDGPDGEYVYTSVWRFSGNFTDLDDPAFDNAGIEFLGDGEYSFDNGELNNETVFSPLRDADGEIIALQDNVRYIFCAETDVEEVFFTFDTNINYERNFEEVDRQPYMLIRTPDFGLGFVDFYGTPAIGVQFIDAVFLGLGHQDDVVNITPFPNPAVSVLNIPVANLDGKATLEIVDVTGRSVKTENIEINGTQNLSVDVTAIPNGTYLFNMNFENGKSSTFRVVINK